MKKTLIIFSSVFGLSACGVLNNSSPDPIDSTPEMMHHSDDNKGSSYFPVHRAATGKKVVIFSPRATAWAAYDSSGNRVKTGRASGGKNYCADVGRGCKTPTGKFSFYSKKGADCKSGKYPIETGGGAPMPYCMHFKGGYAMHGSYHIPDYNASHGCVRITPSAAKWLSENFVNNGTTMIVEGY